ncbi:hypothetical protein [Lactococcus lactis]|uniref:hypothetical protein n=1 Tax=Lactococcus lactis TaxID=1358 RepID=UPI001CDB7F24|nr:hypothetical protein [Lactococcus lactis]UBU72158.1 hypothetical protein I6G24_00125 [Lactococcus lactis]
MIYTIGYYIAVIGLVIMMFGFKSFYSQMNKWSRFGFIFLALGLAFPYFMILLLDL